MFELQDEDKSFRFTLTFKRRATEAGDFITETTSNSTTEFGPMPSEIVPAFIKERRTFWQALAEKHYQRFQNDLGAFGTAEMVWPPNALSVE